METSDAIGLRQFFGLVLLTVSSVAPCAITLDNPQLPDALVGIGAAAIGGAIAGFVASRSLGARLRTIPAATICAVGAQIANRLMPQLLDAGKYVNMIPSLLGGLPGIVLYVVLREDANAADQRFYQAAIDEQKRLDEGEL